MIMILKTSHHGPSDARHNPSQLLRLLLKEVCFISHRDQHVSIGFLIPRSLILKRWQSAPASDRSTRFYRLSYSEIVDIEKVAVGGDDDEVQMVRRVAWSSGSGWQR
ncbi:hypothetical protein Tco_0214797 [Tanacetum coccineum]